MSYDNLPSVIGIGLLPKVGTDDNKPLPSLRPHETHYACDKRLKKYGGETVGCCCTGHECKPEGGDAS